MTDPIIVNMTLYGGDEMSDILERLQRYNPPDRTIDTHRHIAQDIYDAAVEIERLTRERDELKKKVELYDKALERKAMLEDDVVLLKHDNKELKERMKGWEEENVKLRRALANQMSTPNR